MREQGSGRARGGENILFLVLSCSFLALKAAACSWRARFLISALVLNPSISLTAEAKSRLSPFFPRVRMMSSSASVKGGGRVLLPALRSTASAYAGQDGGLEKRRRCLPSSSSSSSPSRFLFSALLSFTFSSSFNL